MCGKIGRYDNHNKSNCVVVENPFKDATSVANNFDICLRVYVSIIHMHVYMRLNIIYVAVVFMENPQMEKLNVDEVLEDKLCSAA